MQSDEKYALVTTQNELSFKLLISCYVQLDVKSVRMVHDKETGVFKRFCYVEFDSAASLESALEVNGAQYMDNFIRVDIAGMCIEGVALV